MKKNLLAPFALALAAVLTAAPALAERADRDKPMNVEADALRYDDATQTSVFTGRVVVTKGTIVIRGARVTVRQDPQGFQFGVVTAAPGQRAFFRQKREGADEYVEGEAETIEYDGRSDRIKLVGRAELRRLRGATVSDEASGALITYDNSTEQFAVDGAPGGATPAHPGGRVRATIGPRASSGGPAAAASAPSAAPLPAASAPRLRRSDKLGQETR